MSDRPATKPQRPRYVRKYGKTIGTAQHQMVTYRGRIMRSDVAQRMYDRDLATYEASRES